MGVGFRFGSGFELGEGWDNGGDRAGVRARDRVTHLGQSDA